MPYPYLPDPEPTPVRRSAPLWGLIKAVAVILSAFVLATLCLLAVAS